MKKTKLILNSQLKTIYRYWKIWANKKVPTNIGRLASIVKQQCVSKLGPLGSLKTKIHSLREKVMTKRTLKSTCFYHVNMCASAGLKDLSSKLIKKLCTHIMKHNVWRKKQINHSTGQWKAKNEPLAKRKVGSTIMDI